jgi:hypothetical protein
MTIPAFIAELASTLLVEAAASAARFIFDVVFVCRTHAVMHVLLSAVPMICLMIQAARLRSSRFR